MKIYLCGPINGCTDAECIDWRQSVREHFPEALDPMRRDYRGREAACYREIVDLDKRDVRECRVILVNWSKPSVGTSMEIFYAWTLGIPVVLWCAPGTVLSPWLHYHATAVVHSLSEALEKVTEIG